MSFHPVLSHCHQRFSLYLRGNPIAKVCRLSTGYVLHTNILFPIINSSYSYSSYSQPNASLPHHTEGRCEVTERYFYLVNCRLFTYTSHSKINDFVGAVILGQTTPIFNITCLSLSISLPGSSPDIPLLQISWMYLKNPGSSPDIATTTNIIDVPGQIGK